MVNNPRKPSEKSYVELSVRLVQDRVLKRMQIEQSAFYLSQANSMLMELVDREINAVGFCNNGTGTQRKELFDKYERAAAVKLVEVIPEFAEYIPYLKVDRTYAVTIGKHRYSVPWRYAGEVVQAELSTTRVKIFFDHKLITEHRRDDSSGSSAKDEHMKPEHLAVKQKRDEFPDVGSIIVAAGKESPVFGDFCHRFFKFYDIDVANGIILLIRMYRNPKNDRCLLDEAMKRLMSHPTSEWNSYVFDQELSRVHSEAKAGDVKVTKLKEQSGTNDNSSSLCLHGRDEFVGKDHETATSNGNLK